ncbi:MAG: serine--tRNA ligase [bacterium]
MFRPQNLREDAEAIRSSLKKRGQDPSLLDEALEIDRKRREIIEEVESLQHEQNEASEKIGQFKREGQDEKAEAMIEKTSELKKEIEDLNERRNELDESLEQKLLRIPNVLQDTVPEGDDESDNRVEETVGEIPSFDFEPEPHWDLAEDQGFVDFEQAQTISGSRFAVHHAEGARLERALINFMLDVQTEENGYEETMTPVLVRERTMEGTGQLPKFKDDMFQTSEDGYYLIPTSEVSLINLYRDTILKAGDLPISKTARTACFRREAGAHGKDTRGLMRQHQFNKVELVKITHPDASEAALQDLLGDARSVLEKLELPYRVVTLCAGDTGFAATKTFDLEVWIPSQDRYREISSCSNCRAFQARRANIQYRPDPDADTQYCHTLNGSGLAIGRCWLAIVENFQQKDGTVTIPDALRPYLDGKDSIGLPLD